MLHYRDGKTATVALIKGTDGGVTLSTNGKPDAKINMGPGEATPDEPTMVLLGALAHGRQPDREECGEHRHGLGIDCAHLAQHAPARALDIIEIEAQMVEAARKYGDRVHNAFDDPAATSTSKMRRCSSRRARAPTT